MVTCLPKNVVTVAEWMRASGPFCVASVDSVRPFSSF
jgi:hypothetical protein